MKLIILLSLTFSFHLCFGQKIQEITNEELLVLLEDPEMQLVDVRTPKEVAGGQIKGAVHINLFDEDFEEKVGKLDKDKPIAFYCAVGARSLKAANISTGLGFTQVYNLQQGYTGWLKEERPVEK